MRVGSLFSGIGGLDLGLERAGMTVAWQAETDPFCCEVLEKHWPDVPNLGDVTEVDWSEVGHVDLVCGGFPCQPVSLAGIVGKCSERMDEWAANNSWDALRSLWQRSSRTRASILCSRRRPSSPSAPTCPPTILTRPKRSAPRRRPAHISTSSSTRSPAPAPPLQVATGHGRDAIGIDIDERNADLARERLGMFLTVECPDCDEVA